MLTTFFVCTTIIQQPPYRFYDIQFLYQKAGYIFERYKTDFVIKDELIDACQRDKGWRWYKVF